MQHLQMLQDAARSWRSSKETKQTRTRRCKTLKCCKMLVEDEGDETQPCGCKYPTPPCALAKILPETTMRAHYKHISYFLNKHSLSLYLYTRGLLGCLLASYYSDKKWHSKKRFLFIPYFLFNRWEIVWLEKLKELKWNFMLESRRRWFAK